MTNAKQGTEFTFHDIKLENSLWNPDTFRSETNFKKISVKSADGSVTLNFESQKDLNTEFLKLLSVAHQCMPEKMPSKNGQEPKIFYQGPSPDEVTLVEFAQQHAFEYYYGSEDEQRIRIGRKVENGKEVDGIWIDPKFDYD